MCNVPKCKKVKLYELFSSKLYICKSFDTKIMKAHPQFHWLFFQLGFLFQSQSQSCRCLDPHHLSPYCQNHCCFLHWSFLTRILIGEHYTWVSLAVFLWHPKWQQNTIGKRLHSPHTRVIKKEEKHLLNTNLFLCWENGLVLVLCTLRKAILTPTWVDFSFLFFFKW